MNTGPYMTLAPVELGPQSSGEGRDTVPLIAGRTKGRKKMKMKNTALFFSQDALMSSAWKFPEQYKSTEAPARETAHRTAPWQPLELRKHSLYSCSSILCHS